MVRDAKNLFYFQKNIWKVLPIVVFPKFFVKNYMCNCVLVPILIMTIYGAFRNVFPICSLYDFYSSLFCSEHGVTNSSQRFFKKDNEYFDYIYH